MGSIVSVPYSILAQHSAITRTATAYAGTTMATDYMPVQNYACTCFADVAPFARGDYARAEALKEARHKKDLKKNVLGPKQSRWR